MIKDFFSIKPGDIVIVYDEYSHDYEEHALRVDSVETDKEYATETNPKGVIAYGTDLGFYDIKKGDYFTDDYITQITEGNFCRMSNLEDRLTVLGANQEEKVETDHFIFYFHKDENFDISKDDNENNIVTISICDKDGVNVGSISDCHLLDYDFSEDALEMAWVEGTGFAENSIDDDFNHQPYEGFLKNLEQNSCDIESR